MTKITLNSVGDLTNTTTSAANINANSSTIQTAFENTLSRDGTSPNQMNSNFDMNSHRIVNLPVGVGSDEPVTVGTFNAAVIGEGNMPVGGSTGQALIKESNTDYDTGWSNIVTSAVTSVGLALPADFTVTGTPITTSGVLSGDWVTAPTGTGAMVRKTNPTFSGNVQSGTFNNVIINTPASTALLALGSGKTVQFNNSLTLGGTDGTTQTFPSTSATIARIDAGQTFIGTNTFTSPIAGSITGSAGTVTTNANLTGDVTSAGNATTLAAGNAGNLNSGTLLAARMPALTGEATTSANAVAVTLTNSAVIGKVLTGYTSGAGTVASTDTILQAIQKLNGNDATNANLTGDVTSVGNATTLTNAPVIAKVLTGYASGAGTVSASDSILSAIQKLNGNDATNANLTGDVTSVGNATTLTNAPVIAKVLTGYSAGVGTVASTDSILQALQKLGALVDNAAWTTYSPTVTSGTAGGTPATYVVQSARYKQIGKSITAAVNVSVSNQGVGATGDVVIALPFTASSATNASWVGVSREFALLGKSGFTFIGNGATTMTCRDSTNATYIATGAAIIAQVTYEIP